MQSPRRAFRRDDDGDKSSCQRLEPRGKTSLAEQRELATPKHPSSSSRNLVPIRSTSRGAGDIRPTSTPSPIYGDSFVRSRSPPFSRFFHEMKGKQTDRRTENSPWDEYRSQLAIFSSSSPLPCSLLCLIARCRRDCDETRFFFFLEKRHPANAEKLVVNDKLLLNQKIFGKSLQKCEIKIFLKLICKLTYE